MIDIGETVEKLCIANIKLFMVCDKKELMAKNPQDYTKEEMARVMEQDIQLCRERARLKNEIRKAYGQNTVEVKSYGGQ